MSNPVSHDNEDIWLVLKDTYVAYTQALGEFLSKDVDRVNLLKSALRKPGHNVAIKMLEYLSVGELEGLFEELVFLASFSHGAIEHVRNQILRLPKEWVLDRIESVAEPLLANGTYDEYRRLLELYKQLDPRLTKKLAARATENSDPDIHEAGLDFLAREP